MEVTSNKDFIQEDQVINRIRPLRSEDVSCMVTMIRQAEIGKLRQTIRYYPLRFLADGIDAYRYGFDNAAIFYVGTAVELALLALLQDEVKLEQQRQPRRNFNFSWLINHSGSLLDRDARRLCHNIRVMRNCYIHYENIVAHLAWMQEVDWPQKMEQMKVELGNDSDTVKFIDLMTQLINDEYSRKGMLPIRFEHLETNREVIPFIEQRYKQYMAWLPQAWSSKQRELSREEFENIYSIEAFDALECITWAFEILHKLKLI